MSGMKRFDPLRDLLVENLVHAVFPANGRRCVCLKEGGVDARLKKVDILDVPKGSILIKLDEVDQPKSLFKGKKGERQRCDYVLLTSFKGKPFLVFFELKSRTVKKKEITKQFKGAECLMDYCDAALNRFFHQKDLLKDCEKRFVVFFKPAIAKQATRKATPALSNTSPETPFKYAAPRNPSLKALISL
jgi:hypothetical protein